MPDTHLAEWILSLVTSRDRAASTAGDLTEEKATRGAVWFWSSVLRTAASHLWRGVAEHSVRMAGLAFLGLALYIAIDLLFAGLSGVAFFIAAFPSGKHLQLDSIGWRIWFTAPVLVSSLLIGLTLARWARGRELSACVVFAILLAVYNLAPMLGDNGGFPAVLSILIVSATVVWGRNRRHQAAQPIPL
jgi:hypothetical protein